jgi:hypothetical protein
MHSPFGKGHTSTSHEPVTRFPKFFFRRRSSRRPSLSRAAPPAGPSKDEEGTGVARLRPREIAP